MLRKKGILIIFVLAVLVIGIILLVGRQVFQKRTPRIIELTGQITMVGNEPFTQLVIKTKDGSLYGIIDGKLDELKKMQGERVKVRGLLIKESSNLYKIEKNIKVIDFEAIK